MFTLSFHDSIVSRLILNQGKDGSLREHRTHRMIQGPSNAYTGQSMLKSKRAQATLALEGPVGGLVKSKRAQATLALEGPVGGLVIAMKSSCKSSPNRSSMA